MGRLGGGDCVRALLLLALRTENMSVNHVMEQFPCASGISHLAESIGPVYAEIFACGLDSVLR